MKAADFPASSAARFSRVDKGRNITSRNILGYIDSIVKCAIQDLTKNLSMRSMLPATRCRCKVTLVLIVVFL